MHINIVTFPSYCDIFFLSESRLNLGCSLTPSLHVVSKILAQLLAHMLQMLSMERNVRIGLILLNELGERGWSTA